MTAPYTDVVQWVPRDYLWLYPALALQACFLVMIASLAATSMVDRPGPALVGVAFSAIGAGVLVTAYGLQLLVVQPSLLAGETDGLGLWTQYDPHGIFIGLEDLGYAALAVGNLFVGALLSGRGGPLRVARWAFWAGGGLTWVALVGLAAGYRAGLEYRFELAALTAFWLVSLTAGAASTVEFRRTAQTREVGP